MNRRIFSWLTVVCLTVPALAFAADGKRLITEVDLYNFQWIANPQISPDGAKVIYTLVKTTAKHDNYETTLWIIPSADNLALTEQRAAGVPERVLRMGNPARQMTSGLH